MRFKTLLRKDPANRWLFNASIFTIVLVMFYFGLHFLINGREQIYLQQDQLTVINTFATQDSMPMDLIYNYMKVILPVEENVIREVVGNYTPKQLITVLPTYPFKAKSFFWLTGNMVLLEVVFWSLFGLIAGLMYSVTIAKEFKEERIREHIGKVFYTPFVCLIIYLALNALVNGGSIVLTGIGKSVIVLSFILGFFTRRAILLLVKIKDLILPKGKEAEELDRSLTEETGDIDGVIEIEDVSDSKNANIKQTAIKITSLDSGVEKELFPDENGKFSYPKAPFGNYKIVANLLNDSTVFSGEASIDLKNKSGNLGALKLKKEV